MWSTHFVAMLGYRPEAPVEFHLGLTAFSMAIAIVGCTFALMFAALSRCKYAAQIGGAFFGLAIASMHYTGMIAYRVQGIVYWDMNYLIASVVIAVVVSAAALTIGRGRRRRNEVLMAVILTLGIVSLHFTGMAAFGVYPLLIDGTFANAAAFKNLALAVSGTAVVIVFGGFISYVLENRARLESIAELTEARNAAESASKAKSEFLSVLSHELRTPLSIIMGYSTMLSKMGELQMKAANTNGNNVKTLPSPTLEQVELYGKKIPTSSQHLLTLINEILDYSSMELDETKLEKTSFSVRDLLEEVTEQFKVLTEEKGITVALACDEPIVAYADRARIMQILINLLGNAVKFSS
ncbi:MAG: MHYT domain-containing protein, partial [Woeseiaceae bacterium]